MLQAHQQPEAANRGPMQPANAASMTTRGPGLPRVPLSQASLNTPQAFASSSGSPAPSTASTNTGEITIPRHDCVLDVCNLSRVTHSLAICCNLYFRSLNCLQWNFELLHQACRGLMAASIAILGQRKCVEEGFTITSEGC